MMRRGIASDSRDPLATHFVLASGEPVLRQNFHQSGLRIQYIDVGGGILARLGGTGSNQQQFVNPTELLGDINLLHAVREARTHFEFSQRFGR